MQFPNWTAGSIVMMPETHIMEWAERNGVQIDKSYAMELREGGTQALGANIPAVSHDRMDALPREKWEQEKNRYIYETWLKNASAVAQPH